MIPNHNSPITQSPMTKSPNDPMIKSPNDPMTKSPIPFTPDEYKTFLRHDCRSLLHSAWYQQLFPTRLSAERQAIPEFHTTSKGVRLATSIGGVLTGRGADFIIIDDPLKPDEALSEAQRTAANEWFDHTLYSRLNDKRTGAIIVIMQRLHEDDLTG